MLLLFAGMQRTRASGPVPMALPSFGLGYLAVWAGFSACAAIAQEALHRAALLSPAMAASSPRMAGAISDCGRRVPIDALQGRVSDAVSQPAWISDEQLA